VLRAIVFWTHHQKEFDMKKLMLTGVMAALWGVTVWAVAEPAHDHEHGNVAASQAPMNHASMMVMRDQMRLQMQTAQNDAQRHALMDKHHEQMQAQMSTMQGMAGHMKGHAMGDMNMNHSDMMKGMR
jgi:hypothetical protein